MHFFFFVSFVFVFANATEASSHRTQHTPGTDNTLRVCTTLQIHTRPEPLSPLCA